MAKKGALSILISFLILFFLFGGFSTNLLAGDLNSEEREMLKKHLLATETLRKAMIDSSHARLANIEKLEKQLSKWGFDATQVKTAVRTLTNSELLYLVRQSESANKNFFGGASTGKTVGLITIGALVAFIIVWEATGLSAGATGWD